MTGEEIVEGLKLLEDNMVHFDELQNDKGEWIDVHELLFEAIQALEQQPCERFEWGIDGNVYKITKAKDGKEICQQVCNDAISRKELLKAIDTWDRFGVDDTNSLFRLDNLSLPHYVPYIHYDDVVKSIKGMPPVTPQQKYGKWIEHPEIETNAPEYLMFYECSECGDKPCFCKSDIHKKRFCSNCGAKMESEVEE